MDTTKPMEGVFNLLPVMLQPLRRCIALYIKTACNICEACRYAPSEEVKYFALRNVK